MKYIVVGHINMYSNFGFAIPSSREPLWQVFLDEASARDYIKKHNVEITAIYKAEEIPLIKDLVEETHTTRKLVTEWK